MSQQVQVPTLEQLEANLTQLVLQRAQFKDGVEQIEKQMAVVHGQVQLLHAQAAKAKGEPTKD